MFPQDDYLEFYVSKLYPDGYFSLFILRQGFPEVLASLDLRDPPASARLPLPQPVRMPPEWWD